MNQTVKIVAEATLMAVKLREESYDHVAADYATKNEKFVNYAQFYKKTLEEACDEAASATSLGVSMGQLIYLALHGWWNDTIEWAKRVTDPTATHEPSTTHCQHGKPYGGLPEEDTEDTPVDISWHCELCQSNFEKEENRLLHQGEESP